MHWLHASVRRLLVLVETETGLNYVSVIAVSSAFVCQYHCGTASYRVGSLCSFFGIIQAVTWSGLDTCSRLCEAKVVFI
jgi:hypothetical protein